MELELIDLFILENALERAEDRGIAQPDTFNGKYLAETSNLLRRVTAAIDAKMPVRKERAS